MGRKPKLRMNFNADSGYLIRLADAIAQDRTIPAEWRVEASGRCQSLAAYLLGAPERVSVSRGG